MSIPMLVLTGLLTLATGIIVLVAARLVRALRHTVELEQRVTRLQEGINLLTDTAETGFRQVAAEVERLSSAAASAAPAPASRPTAVRLRAATRRGRTVKDIAAAEQVSEGEVRLRLSLADAGAAGRTRPSSAKTNALRA
jgi:hypothetical protein